MTHLDKENVESKKVKKKIPKKHNLMKIQNSIKKNTISYRYRSKERNNGKLHRKYFQHKHRRNFTF